MNSAGGAINGLDGTMSDGLSLALFHGHQNFPTNVILFYPQNIVPNSIYDDRAFRALISSFPPSKIMGQYNFQIKFLRTFANLKMKEAGKVR